MNPLARSVLVLTVMAALPALAQTYSTRSIRVVLPYPSGSSSNDSVKDLAPIAMVAKFPYVLVVPASLPVHNVKELIAYAKANPGKIDPADTRRWISAGLTTGRRKDSGSRRWVDAW